MITIHKSNLKIGLNTILCSSINDKIYQFLNTVVGEQPYKNRDIAGSDSGLGHLLVKFTQDSFIDPPKNGNSIIFIYFLQPYNCSTC